jgi:hypothetical protein
MPASLARNGISRDKDCLVHEFKYSAKTDVGQACHDPDTGGYKYHPGIFTRKKKFLYSRIHNFSGTEQP